MVAIIELTACVQDEPWETLQEILQKVIVSLSDFNSAMGRMEDIQTTLF